MATHNQFVASVTVTLQSTGLSPTPVTLPAVDASNTAVLLQNAGPGSLQVFAGTSPVVGSISQAPGVMTLREGEARLLPNHPGLSGGTVATVQSAAGGAQLLFSRGTATPVWLFAASATTVI